MFLVPPAIILSRLPTATFASSASDVTNLTTYTLSISGMQTTGKRLIGVLSSRGGAQRTITAITLDGQTPTLVAELEANNAVAAFYIVDATANTTANLEVTFDATADRCVAGVWNINNLPSNATFDIATLTARTTTTTMVQDIYAPTNSLVFGLVTGDNPLSWTWSGLTESFDHDDGGESFACSGAHIVAPAGSSGGLTVTATGSTTIGSGTEVMLLISFGNKTNGTMFQDFGDFAIASGLPRRFTERSGTTSITYDIQAEGIAGSVSGQELKLTLTADADRMVSFDPAGNTDNDDVEILTCIYMTGSDGADASTHGGNFIRRTGADGAENAYFTAFRTDGSFNRTIFSIRKHLSGTSSTVLADTGFSWSLNTRYWVRLRAVGTAIKAKAWEDGSSEPAAWTLEATDSDVTGDGYVGIYAFNDNGDPACDYISVAFGGNTAPGP